MQTTIIKNDIEKSNLNPIKETNEKNCPYPSNLNNSTSATGNNSSDESLDICLDSILEESGYNPTVFKIIILTGFIIILDGFYISYFNYSNFIGMGLGSLISGVISKKFSRTNIIIFCLILMLGFHLLFSMVKHVILFSLCRFIISALNGIILPLQLNILTEHLPVTMRSFILNLIWACNGVGNAFFLYMCKIYFPTLEYDKNKELVNQDFYKALLQNYVLLIVIILSFFLFLNDSPRNLIINKKYENSNKILIDITGVSYTIDELMCMRRKLIDERENKFYNTDFGYKEIFQKRILSITLLLLAAYFFISFGRYGMLVTFPEILKKVNSVHKNNKESINDLLWAICIGLIGNLIGAIFSEIKFFGRKFSEILFFSISLICAILGFVYVHHMYILMGCSISTYYISYKLHITYTEEIYPTIIKDYAMGAMFFSTRLGGFLSQFFYLSLMKSRNNLIPIFYCINCIVLIVIIFFLPNDNTSKLDSFLIEEAGSINSSDEKCFKFINSKEENDEKINFLEKNKYFEEKNEKFNKL